MDFFWETVDTIDRTRCDGFSHFDTGHLIWLVLFLCFCIVCTVIYAKLAAGGSGKKKMRLAFAVVLIADELLKYGIVLADGVTILRYVPLQLCSISVLIVILHAFLGPGHSYIENFLYLIGLPAGLSALLFPAWTALPVFANAMSIHSFTAHILLVTYIVMLLAAKEIRPEIKRIPVCVLALLAMAFGVYKFDMAFGMNYMYLVHLSPASPLAVFQILGDYRIGYAIILAGLILVLYGVPALLKRGRR